MENKQSNKLYKDMAKEFIEKFSYKTKIEDILNEKDESIIPLLSANLTIFAVSFAVLFSSKVLTSSTLLIFVAAILSLLSGLLNIWYLIRSKTRVDYFKNEQDRVYNKAEANLTKTFEFFGQIIKKYLIKDLENNNKTEKTEDFNFIGEEASFIPWTILELSLSETRLNLNRCLNSPLDEKNAEIKLFIDRLSDKAKNLGLILSSVLMLSALLIKFIIG